jgi:hypothetical protein
MCLEMHVCLSAEKAVLYSFNKNLNVSANSDMDPKYQSQLWSREKNISTSAENRTQFVHPAVAPD